MPSSGSAAIAGGGGRFAAFKLDARDEQAITELIRTERCDAVLNALDPRFVMPVFRAALSAGVTYLDMAMSLSRPHASDPYRQPGVKLGDEQFALAGEWERRGLLALCGIGVEPGLSDVFARYADCLLAQIFQSTACNAIHSIEQRAAKWIVSAMERTNEDAIVPLTHEQLATLLGVGRSYASRVLQTFKAEATLETRRGAIVVKNRAALQARACLCNEQVKTHFEEVLRGVYPTEEPSRPS